MMHENSHRRNLGLVIREIAGMNVSGTVCSSNKCFNTPCMDEGSTSQAQENTATCASEAHVDVTYLHERQILSDDT